MTEPKTLPQQVQAQNPAIASYDFLELITKRGVTTFYPFTYLDEGSTIYGITTDESQISNSRRVSQQDGATSTFTFDTPTFANTIKFEGNGFIYLPTSIYNPNIEAVTSCYWTVQLYHYDGTTEKQLGSDQTTTNLTGGTASSPYWIGGQSIIIIDNINQTFKIGDILRMKLTATISAGGASVKAGLHVNPTGYMAADDFQSGEPESGATMIKLQSRIEL